jgi:Spy/CpxP family protein refolding chaperone
MKRTFCKNIVWAAAVAAALAGTTASAADAPASGAAPAAPTESARPERGERRIIERTTQAPRTSMFGGINLDDKQRDLLREAVQKDAAETRRLEEKLRVAQKELAQVTMAAPYDEQVVREKADAVAKLQSELTLLRARAFATLAPTLTAEQREQMENSPFLASVLSNPGFSLNALTGGRTVRAPEGAPPEDRRPRRVERREAPAQP